MRSSIRNAIAQHEQCRADRKKADRRHARADARDKPLFASFLALTDEREADAKRRVTATEDAEAQMAGARTELDAAKTELDAADKAVLLATPDKAVAANQRHQKAIARYRTAQRSFTAAETALNACTGSWRHNEHLCSVRALDDAKAIAKACANVRNYGAGPEYTAQQVGKSIDSELVYLYLFAWHGPNAIESAPEQYRDSMTRALSIARAYADARLQDSRDKAELAAFRKQAAQAQRTA